MNEDGKPSSAEADSKYFNTFDSTVIQTSGKMLELDFGTGVGLSGRGPSLLGETGAANKTTSPFHSRTRNPAAQESILGALP